MKWIIFLTIFAFLMILYLLRRGIIDGRKPDPDLIWDAETSGLHSKRLIRIDQLMLESLIEDEMYQENDIDEFSPENIELDETLKILKLRKKLNKIEEERSINENE